MNDEELAAIEQRIAEPKPLRTGDMLDLIAEVRRLRQELSDTNEELTISKRLKGMW